MVGMRVHVEAAGNRLMAKSKASQQVREVVGVLRDLVLLRAEGNKSGMKINIDALATQALRTIDVDDPIKETISVDPVAEAQMNAGPQQQPPMPNQGMPPGASPAMVPGQPAPGQPAQPMAVPSGAAQPPA
jgi:hypothetical protein